MGHYLTAWHKDQVLLIGYSFGADVLPFVVADLSPEYRERIATLNLLGLATHTSFEIHMADWIPGSEPEGAPIAPEFDKLEGRQDVVHLRRRRDRQLVSLRRPVRCSR